MNVYWLLTAKESLRAALHGQSAGLSSWLPRINGVLADIFAGQVVLVRDRYSGYRPFQGLVILLVEVQPIANPHPCRFPSPGTYIVKIAFDERRADLKGEIDAWNAARPEHLRHDNVFVSLEAHPDELSPTALVYGDANAVLGKRNIMSLEEAFTQACRFGVPKPESIDRMLRTLYERMATHFFPHSHLEPPSIYLHSERPKLAELLDRYDEKKPVMTGPEYQNDLKKRQHRRETLALLAAEHEHFADPIDLLGGMQRATVGPEVLRGTAHGDLHGLNVHVAIVNDEASQCAVYDYERFSVANFAAWDFIKLEIETAVRLLDRFGANDMPLFVKQCLLFWRQVATRTEAYERHTKATLEPNAPLPGIEWQRLANLIVNLRIIAHENLGRERGRVYTWLDEYELLTAWYASRAALYPNYEPRLVVGALVAAGVAARRLMRRLPGDVELSHRKRFVHAKAKARGQNPDDMTEGARLLGQLASDYPHVLEIREELALVQIKRQNFAAAEDILNGISERYDHTSAETPSLLGSLWKRRAFAETRIDLYALERSLTWYQRAAARYPDDFYPRINVATLFLIQGRHADARAEATAVLEMLDRPGPADFWSRATRGEAMLLLGEDISTALEYYRQAVRDRDCRPQDRKSMHDQIVFLRPHFAAEVQSQLNDQMLHDLFVAPPEVHS